MTLSHGGRRTLQAIMVCAVFLVMGCSGQRSEQLRKEGDTYLHMRKYREAEEAYRTAAEANPENAQARLGLGRCLAAMGRPEDALAIFQETLEIAPEFEVGYLEAAYASLTLGKVPEAVATAQRLEQLDQELGGILHASVLVHSGQSREGLELLEGLRDSFPKSALVRRHLACALLGSGEPGKAEMELNAAHDSDPELDMGARMLMVEVLDAQGKAGESISAQEAIETENPDQMALLAYALLQGGREQEGEDLVRGVVESSPSSDWACFVFGSYLLYKEQRDEAATFLRSAANALSWEPVVLRDLVALRVPETAMAKADSVESDASNMTPVPETAALEDWQSLWRQGALRRLLEERDRFDAGSDSLLTETLFLAAVFLGRRDLADELAQELPAQSPLHTYLDGMKNQDLQTAVDALKPWNEQDSDHQILARNAVGYALGVAGGRGHAVQVLSECAKQFPENGVSLLNLAQVFSASNMPQFAAQALKKLTATFPENIEAHLLVVQMHREAGMLQEARQSAEVMYALFPDSRAATLAACGIYVDFKELERAKRIVENYLQSHPADAEMRLTQASIMFREGHADDALTVLSEVSSPGVFATGVTTLNALCHGVAQNWQMVIDAGADEDLQSMSLALRFILTSAYIETGQQDKAVSVLTATDQDEPSGGRMGAIILESLGSPSIPLTPSEANLASAMAVTPGVLADFASGAAYQVAKLHEEAYRAFMRVDDALSDGNEFVLDRMYRSLPSVANVDDVGQIAWDLAEEHATDLSAWLGCAAILQRLGDVDRERAALEKAAEIGADDPRVILARAQFFAQQENIPSAINEYRRYLQLRPDDPVVNNNLAYNLLLAGEDLPGALKSAQIAAQALPGDPRVQHTLGVAQLRSGDLEESRFSLTSALEGQPGDPAVLLDYGQLLIALGDVENGRRHIVSALNSARVLGLDFSRASEAEEILAKTPGGAPIPPSTI